MWCCVLQCVCGVVWCVCVALCVVLCCVVLCCVVLCCVVLCCVVLCCVVLCCDVLLCECAILPIREVASHSRCKRLRRSQLRGAPHGAPVPADTRTSEHKFCWQQKASDTIDGTRETTKSMHTLCHSSRGFSQQELIFAHCPHQPRSLIRGNFLHKSDWLSLRGIEDPRTRHLADPGDSQQLITLCWQMDLFSEVECTSHLFATERFTSANTALMPFSPAACWLRNQQQQLNHVGTTKTGRSGH